MAETIESFVSKLQEDGIQAGRDQAQDIVAAAQTDAEKTAIDAKSQAEKIIAGAEKQAKEILERGQTELKLASRDTLLQLRETLNRAIGAVLTQAVGEQLASSDIVATLIKDVVSSYAKGDDSVEVAVSSEMADKLTQGALATLASDGGAITLAGTLAQAGFEYSVSGATVEVTTESVTETLASLVNPKLKKLLTSEQ